jgi:hypothetical protein
MSQPFLVGGIDLDRKSGSVQKCTQRPGAPPDVKPIKDASAGNVTQLHSLVHVRWS